MSRVARRIDELVDRPALVAIPGWLMRPMAQFNPDRPALVHDCFHDKAFVWRTGWADGWRLNAWVASDGMAYWDGLILDGWEPMA